MFGVPRVGCLNDVLNSMSSPHNKHWPVHGNFSNCWGFYRRRKLISCFINAQLPLTLVNLYYTRKWINWMFLLGIPARLILVPRQVRLHNGQHRDTASSAAEYNYRKWYFQISRNWYEIRMLLKYAAWELQVWGIIELKKIIKQNDPIWINEAIFALSIRP